MADLTQQQEDDVYAFMAYPKSPGTYSEEIADMQSAISSVNAEAAGGNATRQTRVINAVTAAQTAKAALLDALSLAGVLKSGKTELDSAHEFEEIRESGRSAVRDLSVALNLPPLSDVFGVGMNSGAGWGGRLIYG